MATTEPLHRTLRSFEDDHSSSNRNIDLNYTLLLLAVVSAFTLLPVCYLCARRRYVVSGNPPTMATTDGPNGRRGLDSDAIESLPTMLYSEVKQFNLRQGTLECAICLSEFDDGDKLRHLPHCSHAFHQNCIDTWLESQTTCPVCRADLRASYVPSVAAPETPLEQVVVPAVEVAVSETREEVCAWTPEERERFTLRLPDNLRVELSSRRLSRSATLDTRSTLGKGKRGEWMHMDMDKLSLLARTFSLRSPRGVGVGGRRVGVSRRDEAESSAAATGRYRHLRL